MLGLSGIEISTIIFANIIILCIVLHWNVLQLCFIKLELCKYIYGVHIAISLYTYVYPSKYRHFILNRLIHH